MNNLSSYCGLTDSRMSASEKDLPVSVPYLFSFLKKKLLDKNSDFCPQPGRVQIQCDFKMTLSYPS